MATSNTLIIKFPHRISLSHASKLTGYHQDYLGQLCRVGRIKATKIGRNWYTTQAELQNLVSPQDFDVSQFGTEVEIEKPIYSIDGIKQKIEPEPEQSVSAVSKVVIKPIATTQTDRKQHHLQSLVNRIKLDQLQERIERIEGAVEKLENVVSKQDQTLSELGTKHFVPLQHRYSPNLEIFIKDSQGINEMLMPKNQNKIIDQDEHDTWSLLDWLKFVATAGFAAVVMILIISSITHTSNQTSTAIYQNHNILSGSVAGVVDDLQGGIQNK